MELNLKQLTCPSSVQVTGLRVMSDLSLDFLGESNYQMLETCGSGTREQL